VLKVISILGLVVMIGALIGLYKVGVLPISPRLKALGLYSPLTRFSLSQ